MGRSVNMGQHWPRPGPDGLKPVLAADRQLEQREKRLAKRVNLEGETPPHELKRRLAK